MKLQARAAENFLRKPDPDIRGILLYGPDEGQVRERIDELKTKLLDNPQDPFLTTELASEQISSDPARLVDEANALSLIGGRRVVFVRDATDKTTNAFSNLSANAVGDNVVIAEGGDLPPRSGLRKLFESAENFVAIACYVDDERNLEGLLADQLRQEGITVEREALQYLASRLTGNRALARRAAEKLALYAGDTKWLTLDDVITATGDASALEIDTPARAAAEGDRAEVDRALTRLLAEGTQPTGILRAGQSYFRRLHIARSLIDNGQSADQAMAALRPPVFFKQAPQFRQQLQSWPLPQLRTALERLIECEAAAKRTGSPDTLLLSRTFILIAQLRMERRR